MNYCIITHHEVNGPYHVCIYTYDGALLANGNFYSLEYLSDFCQSHGVDVQYYRAQTWQEAMLGGPLALAIGLRLTE